MAFRIKNNKLNILWPVSILKFGLPFFSYTFFGQSFLLLSSIFDCIDDHSFVSSSLKCKSGTWFKILGPITAIGIFLQSIIAIMTNILFFKPIFINIGSDLLKKSNSFPDTIFIFLKIGMNLIVVIDKGNESDQWIILFFAILFSGTNAYYYLYYQNRVNKILNILNNILSLTLVSAYITLFIGKILHQLDFTGSIYLFFTCIIIIFIYIFFYKNRIRNFISIDYKEINNSLDYISYVAEFYNIIKNKKNSRNYYALLESLISKIEENCIISDCPLKKYSEEMKNGVEIPFLLNQFCEILFEYGIKKFPNDINLKNNYTIFLITDMNYKKKALIILNSIKKNNFSFEQNYYSYRTSKLLEKWNFSIMTKNNSVFEYKKYYQDFKSSIKKLTLLYYDFLSLLLNSKFQNNDSFNKIHKIGREILKINSTIDKDYNKLINIQADNIEIIKLYLEFVQGVLCDEEKMEKCQNNLKVKFSSIIEDNEKDFSNFDIETLNEKGHLPFLIVSTHKEYLGKIINLSLNVLNIFGYTKNELIGQHINILMPKIFHRIHNMLLIKENEKQKLKLFDDLNKRIVYFPEFIKKKCYGISKMRFLIELNLNIYFVKTEENKIVFIVEIEHYNPFVFDLLKNINNNIKYCVLTDENFLIQTFTPNCMDYLKLNYSDINSNFSIINHIKQFQDDYLTAINNTGISRFSHFNKSEIFSEDKFSDQKSFKSSIPPNIKKKIKNDLFLRKYSKKCKITWKFKEDLNLSICKLYKKNKSNKNSEISNEYSKSSIFKLSRREKTRIINDKEINLYMEIEKIIIKQELIGFYFYFTPIKIKNYNNLGYILENNDNVTNDKNNFSPKIKKYKCKFITLEETLLSPSKFQINKSNFFSSLIIKPSKIKDKDNKDINKIKKKERKNSLDKNSKVKFKCVNPNNPINNCSYTDKYLPDDDGMTITGDFIPKYTSHFSIDIKNSSFFRVNENEDKLEYLEILKKEANDKKNKYEKQLKLLTQDSEESCEESEENESYENSSINSQTSLNSSNYNSYNNSLYNNIRAHGGESNKSLKKTISSNISKKKSKKDIQINTNNENNISLNMALSSKNTKKKNSLINSLHRVNITNIRYMIFDFNKDMIVEGNKDNIVSNIDKILFNNNTPAQKESEKDKKEEIFPYVPLFINKNKKNNKENKEKYLNINKTNNIIEEKLFKKRINEALNKHKDEPPIIKLKIFLIICYSVMIIYGIIILILLDISFLSKINIVLDLIKNIITIKYCSQISIYYLREMTLLNFEVKEIRGGNYTNFPANNKEEYKALIKEKIMELFIESQASLKIIYSSTLSLNKNSINILSKHKLKIRNGNFPQFLIDYDILTALMQYSSAFYNLASSTTPLVQNHTDLSNFIYNNLNGYKEGLNIFIEIYKNELENFLNIIIVYAIISIIMIFIFFIAIFFIVILNFLAAVKTRGNYMQVFYGINENILNNLINNCENLLKKLKTSEEQSYLDEEATIESIEDKIKEEENQNNQNKNNSQKMNLKYEIDNKENNKTSHIGISFMIIFVLFILIAYLYYIFSCIYLINSSKMSISVSNFCYEQQYYHLKIIDFFNIYREFLFDNQSIINDQTTISYIIKYEKEEIPKLTQNFRYLRLNTDKFLKNRTKITDKSLCSYYINDFFDSSVDCEERVGLITNYDFVPLSYNFIEEIKINKNIIRYALLYGKIIVGNLTEYNYSDIINNNEIPKVGEYYDNNTLFRLDLFNDENLHFKLNIMFFSIIIPYIEENRKTIYNILTIGKGDDHLILVFILFLTLITLIFVFYFIPIINHINRIIYKTKNMLSIIPLNILSSQSGVSELLQISKEK